MPLNSLLFRSLRAYQIFGANTDVGKTIFTTLLCRTAARQYPQEKVSFIKPVSTGAVDEADEQHISKFTSGVDFKTLVQYDSPVSPHLAAQSSKILSDAELLVKCRQHAEQCENGWLFMETAGGVHSPTPTGTTQADMYIPLRAPVILVGDARLGGISQTIAAFEALRMRGYDVQSVMLFQDNMYQNYIYLTDYFHSKYNIPVMSTAAPPELESNIQTDQTNMEQYYSQRADESVANVLQHLDTQHQTRIQDLEEMPSKAHSTIWYPFTQQKLLSPERITAIDSAYGDYFQTLNKDTDASVLKASFDGSASWWTQGLGHANPQLTLAASYAAGRYGHVMFAESIHKPALTLADSLLKGMGNPRMSRVFFSDNGSTGIEVALKMGLRAAKNRYNLGKKNLGVIGLKGGYHGDTIGAMDCAEPCTYNEKIEWYEGKGYWFDYPTILCSNGTWEITTPTGESSSFGSLDDIFDIEAREKRGEHLAYEKTITAELEKLSDQGRKFGALILEPIVLGAGGMSFVDPLFQRALVQTVRKSPHLFGVTEEAPKEDGWAGLPVIFDEVFTGLYRLGRYSPSSFLGVHPDISVHAKLLTGGLVPLCTTLASEEIFDTFSSDDKADALLHGHSYTAHPIGCQVAVESLAEMQKMDRKGKWDWAKKASGTTTWSMWSDELVQRLSQRDNVHGVWALGSVLAVHLKDEAGTGYNSNAAVGLRAALGKGKMGESGEWGIHSRILGNVLYLMTSQTTTQSGVEEIASLLEESM